MLALNDSVNGFMLDDAIGEFILTDPDMKIPPRGKVCSKKFSFEYLKSISQIGVCCVFQPTNGCFHKLLAG